MWRLPGVVLVATSRVSPRSRAGETTQQKKEPHERRQLSTRHSPLHRDAPGFQCGSIKASHLCEMDGAGAAHRGGEEPQRDSGDQRLASSDAAVEEGELPSNDSIETVENGGGASKKKKHKSKKHKKERRSRSRSRKRRSRSRSASRSRSRSRRRSKERHSRRSRSRSRSLSKRRSRSRSRPSDGQHGSGRKKSRSRSPHGRDRRRSAGEEGNEGRFHGGEPSSRPADPAAREGPPSRMHAESHAGGHHASPSGALSCVFPPKPTCDGKP